MTGSRRPGCSDERAVFTGDPDALTTADRELDGVEAALARGRIIHPRPPLRMI
jgi:hypothetical protein